MVISRNNYQFNNHPLLKIFFSITFTVIIVSITVSLIIYLTVSVFLIIIFLIFFFPVRIKVSTFSILFIIFILIIVFVTFFGFFSRTSRLYVNANISNVCFTHEFVEIRSICFGNFNKREVIKNIYISNLTPIKTCFFINSI